MIHPKFSIMLCALVLLLASCGDNQLLGGKRENQQVDAPLPVKVDSVAARTDSDLTKLQDQVLASRPLIIVLLSTSLGSSIMALILAIYMLKTRCKQEPEQQANVVGQVISSYKNRGRIFDLINEHVQKKNQQPSGISEKEVKLLVDKLMDKNFDVIVDRVLVCIQLDKKEAEAIPELPVAPPTSEVLLYASSADSDRNSFFKVTPQPDEDTIYQLTVTGDKSQFVIYNGAVGKVIKANDFLECACEVQKMGSQSVVTKEPGIAEKQGDGTWKITSKAKIKFE